METENNSPDELEIVYPMLSRVLAPSHACATDDTVPLNSLFKNVGERVFCVARDAAAQRVQSTMLVHENLVVHQGVLP